MRDPLRSALGLLTHSTGMQACDTQRDPARNKLGHAERSLSRWEKTISTVFCSRSDLLVAIIAAGSFQEIVCRIYDDH